MTAERRRATWVGALSGALTAVLALALQARASDWQGSETEEFHQSYPISAHGQIELRKINGAGEIQGRDPSRGTRTTLHQPGQYTVYPGAGVRKSGLLAMSSKAPIRLNAFKSPRLWNDWVT